MDFKYSIIDNQVEISEYIGFNIEEIIIPSTIDGYEVISIAEGAFRGLNVRKVIFPEGLRFIGDRAFFECSKIEEIRLPATMEVCEEYSFYHCDSLKYVDMGGTKYILGHCFEQCRMLEDVILSDSAVVLGESCFRGCMALNSIRIPSYLSSLGDSTFAGCKALKEIKIPQKVAHIGKNCFRDCYLLNKIEFECANVEFGSNVFTCYEWKRPIKLDGTEDERYKPKSIIFETSEKTIYCLAGSDAQKYAREAKLSCKQLEYEVKILNEVFYELYLEFYVTLFKDTLWGQQPRGVDSFEERELLKKEMDRIVSDVIPMTVLEKKYRTKYTGRSGKVKWIGDKEKTLHIAKKFANNLNVVAYGSNETIEIETEKKYKY